MSRSEMGRYFLAKLHEILTLSSEGNQRQRYIHWDSKGQAIIITDLYGFNHYTLEQITDANILKFLQRMQYYGWTRIHDPNDNWYIMKHDKLHRGQPIDNWIKWQEEVEKSKYIMNGLKIVDLCRRSQKKSKEIEGSFGKQECPIILDEEQKQLEETAYVKQFKKWLRRLVKSSDKNLKLNHQEQARFAYKQQTTIRLKRVISMLKRRSLSNSTVPIEKKLAEEQIQCHIKPPPRGKKSVRDEKLVGSNIAYQCLECQFQGEHDRECYCSLNNLKRQINSKSIEVEKEPSIIDQLKETFSDNENLHDEFQLRGQQNNQNQLQEKQTDIASNETKMFVNIKGSTEQQAPTLTANLKIKTNMVHNQSNISSASSFKLLESQSIFEESFPIPIDIRLPIPKKIEPIGNATNSTILVAQTIAPISKSIKSVTKPSTKVVTKHTYVPPTIIVIDDLDFNQKQAIVTKPQVNLSKQNTKTMESMNTKTSFKKCMTVDAVIDAINHNQTNKKFEKKDMELIISGSYANILQKLFIIVEACLEKDAIHWSQEGSSLEVVDDSQIEQKIIKNYLFEINGIKQFKYLLRSFGFEDMGGGSYMHPQIQRGFKYQQWIELTKPKPNLKDSASSVKILHSSCHQEKNQKALSLTINNVLSKQKEQVEKCIYHFFHMINGLVAKDPHLSQGFSEVVRLCEQLLPVNEELCSEKDSESMSFGEIRSKLSSLNDINIIDAPNMSQIEFIS